MECVIVQDLFLNETAMYAHVFFPAHHSWKKAVRLPMPNAASRRCAV